MKSPLVSIIIPYHNEAEFVARALQSLVKQDYPKERIEILAVNSNSSDNSREIVEFYAKKDNRIKLFDNPQGFTPISLNIGVKNAKGDFITKSDAHTIYPTDYISKCVRYLEEYKTAAVGGVTYNVPAAQTLAAKAIILVLGSPLGGGGSFRQGGDKPRLADTAYGICYRKEVFRKVGLFNERLIRSQDFDFNLRLTQSGGKILLAPDIALTYYPKQKTIISFWRRNFLDGIWAILPLKFGSPIFKPRHLAPLVFVSTTLATAVGSIFWKPLIWISVVILTLYFTAALYFSLKIIAREKNLLLFPFLILAFAARHFAYGLGSIIGAFRLLTPGK
ncbi:MAG: glycosyltransferase family 2 protein [Candidatus Colwellbacteria bacterium]|nr:glycosyltransferase family 2 protein [Candidatus Colwellbacteria bacterium]